MITEQMVIDKGLLIDGKWKCIKGCGACCKMIGCKLLTKDNLCPIYETRPEICRAEFAERTDMERAKYCFGTIEFIEKGAK